MGKKEFATAVLNSKHETYVVHVRLVSFVISLNFSLLNVHPFHRSQIAGFIAEKAFTKIFTKYSNFADLFSLDFLSKLLEYTKINNYAIKLVDG